MGRPATHSMAAVNGVMAIVLLAWIADGLVRPVPPDRTAPPPVETAEPAEPAQRTPKPASVTLPPPPAPAAKADVAPPTPKPTPKPIPKPAPKPAPKPKPALTPLRPTAERAEAPAREIVALQPEPDKPAPRPRPQPKTVPRPPPEPAPQSTPRPTPNTVARTPAIPVDREAVRDGRQLLRLLEHGTGPGIEIAWPDSGAERRRLHDVLRRCYGMRLALIDRDGGLYVEAGRRGRRWEIDMDRFSGFVRRPNGRISPAERGDAARIARYHGRLPATEPVRLFPRTVDAALLGGLARLGGGDYGAARTITATYRLQGDRLTVGGARIDGRRVAGRIDLSRAGAPGCRGSARS
jgi:hypothetical protein